MVTRDVAPRFRGFLASIMLEVEPGTYVSSGLTQGTRSRIWKVVTDWWDEVPGGSCVMVATDREAPGGLGIRVLGDPVASIAEVEGVRLFWKKGQSSDG